MIPKKFNSYCIKATSFQQQADSNIVLQSWLMLLLLTSNLPILRTHSRGSLTEYQSRIGINAKCGGFCHTSFAIRGKCKLNMANNSCPKML